MFVFWFTASVAAACWSHCTKYKQSIKQWFWNISLIRAYVQTIFTRINWYWSFHQTAFINDKIRATTGYPLDLLQHNVQDLVIMIIKWPIEEVTIPSKPPAITCNPIECSRTLERKASYLFSMKVNTEQAILNYTLPNRFKWDNFWNPDSSCRHKKATNEYPSS